MEVVSTFTRTSIDLWWLRPLFNSGLLLGWIGVQLFGFLIYVAVDQLGDRLDNFVSQQPDGVNPDSSLEGELQLRRRRLLQRMFIGVLAVGGAGVLMAAVGFWFTQTLSWINGVVALFVIVLGTVILLAPLYLLIFIYHTRKWRKALSASRR